MAIDLKAVFKMAEKVLEGRTGLKTLWDPQPVRVSEPMLRLTFMGTEDKGRNTTRIKFQLSLLGAGDGPDVFLTKLIAASISLDRIYNSCTCKTQYVDIAPKVRMVFETGLVATGTFSQNEQKVGETNQWSYLWTEPRYLAIDITE